VILEQHDAHVALYVALRQKVRWQGGIPVCFDCGQPRLTVRAGRQIPAPLWTAFDAEGTPRRICRACYFIAYQVPA
jgi:hypothetical protein